MSEINPAFQNDITADSHLNWHGGVSWDVSDPFLRLRLAAASCFFGEPKYYSESGTSEKANKNVGYSSRLSDDEFASLSASLDAVSPYEWRNLSPRETIEKAIDDALAVDVEKTLQLAVELRNVDHIRSSPQVILVRAAVCKASKGTGLIRKYAPQICVRGDEPAAGLAYFFDEYGKEAPIPNSLKRTWRDKLQTLDDYALAKYRMENNVVKIVDVVNLVRPYSESIDKLVKGELKQTETWQAITSSRDGSTPESIRENWREAAKVMPHMALLRNLRNLAQNGVEISEIEEKLLKGVPGGKQLPFRYFSAYKALDGFPVWQDLTERCLEASFANAPHFKGRVMSICDTSGSAWGATTSDMGTMTIAEIGILSGIITGKLADEGWSGVFAEGLKTFPIRKASSVFDLCESAKQLGRSVGCGTDNGAMLILNEALRKRERWDHIFIYSDMQMGGDYNVELPKLIRRYRAEINPNVLIYFVQIGGYVDVPIPQIFDKVFVLGGWSTGILSFADKMGKMFSDKVETCEQYICRRTRSAVGKLTGVTDAGKCDEATQRLLELKTFCAGYPEAESLLPAAVKSLVRKLVEAGRQFYERNDKSSAFAWACQALNLDSDDVEASKLYAACNPFQNPAPGSRAAFKYGGVEFAFRYCHAGTFTMGSPENEEGHYDDEAQREVTIAEGFWICETETTQEQWDVAGGKKGRECCFKGAKLPVENVNWFESSAFVERLNELGLAPAGWRFVLPTEEQWEYACRAGTTGSTYGVPLDECAWYGNNSGNTTHDAGTKTANKWGIYDMLGNVWEWTSSNYEGGSSFVGRGGGWDFDARNCRPALRSYGDPSDCYDILGFRCVLVRR